MLSLHICLICIILLAVLISSLGDVSGVGGERVGEEFGIYDNLWPSRDTYCERRGLKKSYMPQKCIRLDKCGRIKEMNRYKNCRCVDPRTGQCEICYPEVDPALNAVSVYTDDL